MTEPDGKEVEALVKLLASYFRQLAISSIDPGRVSVNPSEIGDGPVACVMIGGHLDGVVWWRHDAPPSLVLPLPSPASFSFEEAPMNASIPRRLIYRRTHSHLRERNAFRYELEREG